MLSNHLLCHCFSILKLYLILLSELASIVQESQPDDTTKRLLPLLRFSFCVVLCRSCFRAFVGRTSSRHEPKTTSHIHRTSQNHETLCSRLCIFLRDGKVSDVLLRGQGECSARHGRKIRSKFLEPLNTLCAVVNECCSIDTAVSCMAETTSMPFAFSSSTNLSLWYVCFKTASTL